MTETLNSSMDALIAVMQSERVPLVAALAMFRKRYVTAALKRTHGNVKLAAAALGIHRNTVMRDKRALDPSLLPNERERRRFERERRERLRKEAA